METEKRKITIFGSGSVDKASQRWREAYQIGFMLAKAGFAIINGGYGGAMQAAAQGAKEAGGKTIGVTTDEFPGSKKNDFIDREIRVPKWRDRLHKLIELGDGFVILDGGTGTLTELMVVWEMLNKRLHQKPMVVLGRQIQSIVKNMRKDPEVNFPKLLYLAKNAEDAIQYLARELKYFLPPFPPIRTADPPVWVAERGKERMGGSIWRISPPP